MHVHTYIYGMGTFPEAKKFQNNEFETETNWQLEHEKRKNENSITRYRPVGGRLSQSTNASQTR